MWYFVYMERTLSLCTHPVHLKGPHFSCSGLLNERLWEVVVLPQGRPCSTLVRVCYATAITVEDKENVSGWCLKGLSELCFERRRRMMKMMAGYLCFQKYLCWTRPVWILHKSVLFCVCNWKLAMYWCRFLETRGWYFANFLFKFSAISWFYHVFSLKPFSPRILLRTFHCSWSFKCFVNTSCQHFGLSDINMTEWILLHMSTCVYNHPPPHPLQHLALFPVCVYSPVHWLHIPFPCFDASFTSGIARLTNTFKIPSWEKQTDAEFSSHLHWTINTQKDS